MVLCYNVRLHPTREQMEKATAAAAKRTVDPLKSWEIPKRDECPVCMLTLPVSPADTTYWHCCGSTICDGCCADMYKSGSSMACPFCRAKYDPNETEKQMVKKELALAKKGRHEAIRRVGSYHFWGEMGFVQDMEEGLKWYHRAVEKGSSMAAGKLGQCYWWGQGVEQNYAKALEYYQKAIEMGDVMSYYCIGQIMFEMGDIEGSMLNMRKALMCGYGTDDLFSAVREGYRDGFITKDEYSYTLLKHQEAVNEMKK